MTSFSRDAVDERGGHRVDILTAREGVDQERLAAHVRQQSQLDLRVVGGDEHRIIEQSGTPGADRR